MKLSNFYLPTKKQVSSDVVLKSHQLMLRAGMIRQIASGLYAWLPLGLRVLRKCEAVVREELDKAGFSEMLMSTLQPASLWQESGRYDTYGREMLRVTDRHKNELIYGPTAEEAIVSLVRGQITSYKELPCVLYNFQWKFRDEIRPRFGIMRSREFLMMDSYSFDVSEEDAVITYDKHYDAYLKIFSRMGLLVVPTKADSGEIGGDLSHEFHVVAENGESDIVFDSKVVDVLKNVDVENGKGFRTEVSEYYASTDEEYLKNKESDPSCEVEGLKKCKGIEIGHIFYFGTKYSESMHCSVQGKDGDLLFPSMGSYGIGLGRLVAAFIEANFDDNGIIWNDVVNPFLCGVVNLSKLPESEEFLGEILSTFKKNNIDYLLDDSSGSFGAKMSRFDLIGLPFRIVISDKTMADDKGVEVKNRRTGEIIVCNLEKALKILNGFV